MELANFHNLHIIQVQNIFNEALRIVYLKRNEVVFLNEKNQLFFYNPKTKYCHFFNISKDNFSKLYKTFYSLIEQRSFQANRKAFLRNLEKNKYLELKLVAKTRKYAYFSINNNSFFSKNLKFKAKINSKEEEVFLEQNSLIWIKFNKYHLEYIYKDNQKDRTININIIDYEINKKFIEFYFKKINEKTNSKFNFKIKGLNKDKSIIHVSCNNYLPNTFIKYIETYIYKNTSYKTYIEKTN